jgi:signal transduction histidine kinase
MRRFILLVFFFIETTLLFAQPPKLDSLTRALIANPGKLDELQSPLYQEYQKLSPAETIANMKRSVDGLKDKSSKENVAVLKFFGGICWDKQLFTDALNFYATAIELSLSDNNLDGAAHAHMELADRFMNNEMYADALERTYKARELFHSLKDTKWEAIAHAKAASIGFRAGNYNLSAEEVSKALGLYRTINQAEFSRADSLELMNTYNTCGLAYIQLKDYRRAMASFTVAEQLAVAMQNAFWVALISGNKSDIYQKQGEIGKAITSLQLDFRTSVKFRELGSAIAGALALARLHMEKNTWPQAKHYLDTARVLMDITSVSKNMQANYWEATSLYHVHEGNYRQAHEALRLHKSLHDAVDVERQAMNLARVKTNHDIQQQQAQIDLLITENKLHAQQLQNKNTLVVAITLGLFLLTAWLITIYRGSRQRRNDNRLLAERNDEINAMNEELKSYTETLAEQNLTIQKMNEDLEFQVRRRTRELEASNAELDTFLYRASHDIRRPISTLLGLSHLVQFSQRESERLELFDKVLDTAASMDSMLTKLQCVYDLNHPVKGIHISIQQALHNTLSRYAKAFEKAGMDHAVHVASDIVYEADENLLHIILNNLVENAIVFRKTGTERPSVSIDLEQLGNQVVVKCRDNGIGIDSKYLENIFDIHFRATELSNGIGLGLYLVKKAVTQLRGRIEVLSDYGSGTTFIVYLPKP